MTVLIISFFIFILPILINPFLLIINFKIFDKADYLYTHTTKHVTIRDMFKYYNNDFLKCWYFPLASFIITILLIFRIFLYRPLSYIKEKILNINI